ncbi:hypothetical protein KAR91_75090 [Candidatus Pacearchaeota archaeon]|nr:hypothetical protein [Candidatus Pacearchaeota archaeon]
MIESTLIKCKEYVSFVSERDINDADFGLLEEIEDAIKKAIETMQGSKEKDDIIKSLKIANEEKDRVLKKIISDDVEKRMRGGSE